MAEGGDITSLENVSDDDVITCTPCRVDSTKEDAVKYCPECQEYLCATCAGCHSRQKATRSHRLVNKNEAIQSFAVTRAMKCLYHPDRDIEMYCKAHDIVYCTMCIATEHRSCSEVSAIEDLQTNNVHPNEIKHLQTETKSTVDCLTVTIEKKRDHIESLTVRKNDIQRKFQVIEKTMIEHIAKLKTEKDTELDEIHTATKDDLLSDISRLTDMMTNLEKTKTHFQALTNMDNTEPMQEFVLMKLIQKTLKDAKKMYEDFELHGRKSILFKENTMLGISIAASDFGQIFRMCDDVPVVHFLRSSKKVNVIKRGYISASTIKDMCVLKDGTIILADRANKLLCLDKKYKVKNYCNLGASPISICCTERNEIVVKMNNGRLMILSAENPHKTYGYIPITIQDMNCPGLVQFGDELWVSKSHGIDVYSKSWSLLKSISGETDRYTTLAVSGERVIITRFNESIDGAVCLGKDGTRTELRDERLKDVRGVCVSSDGSIFLSGCSSNNIVMFSADGKCRGEFATEAAGLECPCSICYDDLRNCVVATGYSKYLCILEFVKLET